jgi:hypothetical protein
VLGEMGHHRPLQHFQFGHLCLLKVESSITHHAQANRCFRGDLRPVFHTKKNRVRVT